MQFNPMQPTQNYERDQAAAKYRIARLNVMLMLAFTLINIVLLFAESDSFFLFSAMLPYLAVIFGSVIGGTGALVGGIAVAIVILGVYFVLWLFSKKKPDFMIPLLVLFILDTLCTLGFYLIADSLHIRKLQRDLNGFFLSGFLGNLSDGITDKCVKIAKRTHGFFLKRKPGIQFHIKRTEFCLGNQFVFHRRKIHLLDSQ